MTTESQLGPGAEFDAIRQLIERWGPRASGIGDDAAVFRVARGDAIVASVDTAVEGRHFRREWLTPREIGYRAVAAALSDLAAMAARPVGILVAIAMTAPWQTSLLEIADGIGDAVDVANTKILGGNLSGGGELSITTTVFGSAFSPLARAGARANDRVYVTGRLGAPAAALRRLNAGQSDGTFHERFARPVPRLAESRWLVDHGASAGVDISDGLVADARHLGSASGVLISLDGSRIPCADGVEVELALQSGEEYELLVTAPAAIDSEAFERRFGIPLTEIGVVHDGSAGKTNVDVSGVRVANAVGYDHF